MSSFKILPVTWKKYMKNDKKLLNEMPVVHTLLVLVTKRFLNIFFTWEPISKKSFFAAVKMLQLRSFLDMLWHVLKKLEGLIWVGTLMKLPIFWPAEKFQRTQWNSPEKQSYNGISLGAGTQGTVAELQPPIQSAWVRIKILPRFFLVNGQH